MDKKFYGIFILILVVVAGGIYWAATLEKQEETGPGTTGERAKFAQCLSDRGATFYGAWWCPHCARQKELFGTEAMEAVNYVECALPSGEGQTEICKKKNITGYPTWIFGDEERVTGVLTFETLSEKTSCPVPEGEEGEVKTKTNDASATAEKN